MGSWFRDLATTTLIGAMGASAKPRRHGKGKRARRGFRVWRVKLENAGELKRRLAFAMLYGAQGLPKNLLWYESEYQGMLKASLETRRKTGQGYLERLPPVPLLVKFVESGRVVHGATNAGAVEWWLERRDLGEHRLARMIYKMFELHDIFELNIPGNARRAAG